MHLGQSSFPYTILLLYMYYRACKSPGLQAKNGWTSHTWSNITNFQISHWNMWYAQFLHSSSHFFMQYVVFFEGMLPSPWLIKIELCSHMASLNCWPKVNTNLGLCGEFPRQCGPRFLNHNRQSVHLARAYPKFWISLGLAAGYLVCIQRWTGGDTVEETTMEN